MLYKVINLIVIHGQVDGSTILPELRGISPLPPPLASYAYGQFKVINLIVIHSQVNVCEIPQKSC